jgi:hypothetical protein
MSISLTQILIQQGYLTTEQYNYAYQLQQSQAAEHRKPLAQIYLEEGFFGIEHIEYCLRLKQQYLVDGVTPEFEMQVPDQLSAEPQEQAEEEGGVVTCKTCLSECQAGWAMCPFCGSNLK